MFKCFFCDWQAQNETSLFCPECGPSKNWTIDEVDQPKELQNYKKTLRSLFFQAKDSEIESISLGLRERLKISHELHQLFLSVAALKVQVQQFSKGNCSCQKLTNIYSLRKEL